MSEQTSDIFWSYMVTYLMDKSIAVWMFKPHIESIKVKSVTKIKGKAY